MSQSDKGNIKRVLDQDFLAHRCQILGIERMEKYIELFNQNHRETLSEIEKSWKDGDLELLGEKSHLLKGVAQNLGMLELSKVALEIEIAAGNEKIEALREPVEGISNIFQRALESFVHFIEEKKDSD